MYIEENKKRMEQIHTVLMEFASGNFLYKLERTELKDELEALIALVNMTVEEIKDSFLHQEHVNQNETYGHLVQLFFLLDKRDIIRAFNVGVKQLLFFEDMDVRGKPFHSFLTPESELVWNKLKSKLTEGGSSSDDQVIKLSFKTKQGLILTTNCLVGKPIGGTDLSDNIMVISVEMVMASKQRELALRKVVSIGKERKAPDDGFIKKTKRLSTTDIRKIRQVHDHILENLDKHLSPLVELAHSFGTNEYKLKHGFKQLYGQTIFSFLLSERLKKASILIQHSDIPLKMVAHICGFKSAPHFSRAFKEKYDYTPSELRRQSPD